MIVKLAFAFGAGFISFLTPCVLPIIPGYISYITGKNLNEIEEDKKNVLSLKENFQNEKKVKISNSFIQSLAQLHNFRFQETELKRHLASK